MCLVWWCWGGGEGGGGGVVDALLPFLAWNDVASFPQQQHNNNNQDKQHFYRRVWGEEVITLLTKGTVLQRCLKKLTFLPHNYW